MTQPTELLAATAQNVSIVRFRVTSEMVSRFAALTGDQSSLHVDEMMARRSAYRRPIVHGMLPVAFLSLASVLYEDGLRWAPAVIGARFLAPVHVGDRLIVKVERESGASSASEVSCVFSIENETTGGTVTSGNVTAAYLGPAVAPEWRRGEERSAMLEQPADLADWRLEEIERGTEDRLDFRLSQATLVELSRILALGLDPDQADLLDALPRAVHLPNLLGILLFSTSVGVILPGASATFLEFVARARGDLQLETEYTLQGVVVHRSRSTRIVKKELRVHAPSRPDEVFVQGKVSALVNKSSGSMPTIGELRASALDLGLRGRVVLITGASRGIGETVAKLFGLHGSRVVVNYHRGAADAERVVREIAEANSEAIAIPADVSNPADVEALVAQAVARFGTIDVLVNNAVRDFRPIPFTQLAWDEVQRDIDVIAKGAFLCCQYAVPHMIAHGGGKIVNLSTVAVDDPPADQMKYVMAKSALVGLTRSLAVELAPKNIQVNIVAPSFVETDLVAHISDGFRAKIAKGTPMGRHATPAEVAQAIIFLASNYSSYTTGQKVMVNGGGAPYL